MKDYTSTGIAARIWFYTNVVLSVGCLVVVAHELITERGTPGMAVVACIACFLVGSFCSLPALLALSFGTNKIENKSATLETKCVLLLLLQFVITLPYAFAYAKLVNPFSTYHPFEVLQNVLLASAVLFACSLVAFVINYKAIKTFFCNNVILLQYQQHSLTNNYTYMNTNEQVTYVTDNPTGLSPQTKILIKAGITAVLILLMLIPMSYIQDLVKEREERQKEIIAEVSSKWATQQTISAPYLVIPYTYTADTGSKQKTFIKNIFVLAENLDVNGTVDAETRQRSIYNVLLYKSAIHATGNFKFNLPKDIIAENLKLADARLCVGISDFKGIEEKIAVQFNNTSFILSPGLPDNAIDSNGLSTPVQLTAADLASSIPFSTAIKIKGSEQLHFIPLAANSTFQITSAWANPSFDGNTLPSLRTVSAKGFKAQWTFNEANLPFNTITESESINAKNLAFGVSMVQPADQYAKTMRSVKYAILFIGLTFAFFFIIELLQHKPVHPVQYVLVGIALVIFYSLLLSISEFIVFDFAYLIAAIATISLIALYAKGHFQSWKVSGIFASLLTALYGFIFILIRLEDTALLVGSIGLFIVLAITMYASRKINWYQPTLKATPNMV